MTGLKRLTNATTIALLLLLVISGVAFGYLYRSQVAITENASTDYTMLPVIWDSNNDFMADNGFMESDALDTRVQTLSGTNKPWMVSDTYTLTAIPVEANSQNNLYFVTGESDATAMDIIVGNGGYATLTDNTTAEPGDNFTIQWSEYFVPTATGNATAKGDAFNTYRDGSGNFTAGIGLLNPGMELNSDWLGGDGRTAAQAHTGTYSFYTSAGGSHVYQIMYFTPEYRGKDFTTTGWLYTGTATNGRVFVYDGVGYTYSDYVAGDSAWHQMTVTRTLDASATQLRVGFRRDGAAVYGDDFQVSSPTYGFVPSLQLSVSGVSEGVHVFKVTADGTNFELFADEGEAGELSDTVALGTAVVPDNTANWILNPNTYWDYWKLTIGGVLTVWYQPNTMIIGTTLPDRQGDNEAAVITWGSNPAGIDVNVGSMTSSGQPTVGTSTDTSTSDLLPNAGNMDWDTDPAVAGALLTNPMRPVITAISDPTTLSERQVWVFYGLFITLIFFAIGASTGHWAICGVSTCLGIVLQVVQTIFPPVFVVVAVLAIVGGLMLERSPSL